MAWHSLFAFVLFVWVGHAFGGSSHSFMRLIVVGSET
eukprot:SAG31_NODE_43233_length_268_cov_0.603550_1_plen_36_part_10